MRSGVGQSIDTYKQDQTNASQYGGAAQNIAGALTPFAMQRLTNPEGYSQGDMGAMLANAFGSAGGATSAITGQANLQTGRSRNDAGFSTALDDAARQRTMAAAKTSEGIAQDNAGVKLSQQSEAAKMLQGLYGTDVGAQAGAMNNENEATNSQVNAGNSGWLQNTLNIISTLTGAAKAAKPGGF